MQIIAVLSLFLISFFPNPFHRRHAHVPLPISTVKAIVDDDDCIYGDGVYYFIGSDDSIGVSDKSCLAAYDEDYKLPPAVGQYDWLRFKFVKLRWSKI